MNQTLGEKIVAELHYHKWDVGNEWASIIDNLHEQENKTTLARDKSRERFQVPFLNWWKTVWNRHPFRHVDSCAAEKIWDAAVQNLGLPDASSDNVKAILQKVSHWLNGSEHHSRTCRQPFSSGRVPCVCGLCEIRADVEKLLLSEHFNVTGNASVNPQKVVEENEKLREALAAMTRARDDYAKGFSDQSRLHGEFARKYEACEKALRKWQAWTHITPINQYPKECRDATDAALAHPNTEQEQAENA